MEDEPNALEQALAWAANNPAERPAFYRKLLDSPVFVIGHRGAGAEEHGLTGDNDALPRKDMCSLVNWETENGSPYIPFFTSLHALRAALEQEAGYLVLPCRVLFEMTAGSRLVLNPASAYGKEFFPKEVDALLKTGVNHLPVEHVVEDERNVLLGPPADCPAEMVAALTVLLAKHSQVRAAYLCLMLDPARGDEPTLLVGLEGEGDIAQAISEAGAVAGDTAPNGHPVDLIDISGDHAGPGGYLRAEVKPFYERSWGRKLKNLLAPGRA